MASAQPQQGGERRTPPTVEERIEMMDKSLSLSSKQKKEITKIYEAQDKKMQEAGEQADRRAMMEETDKLVAEVLDADQKTKLEEMRKNRGQGQRR